jgi:hypothetical protein
MPDTKVINIEDEMLSRLFAQWHDLEEAKRIGHEWLQQFSEADQARIVREPLWVIQLERWAEAEAQITGWWDEYGKRVIREELTTKDKRKYWAKRLGKKAIKRALKALPGKP